MLADEAQNADEIQDHERGWTKLSAVSTYLKYLQPCCCGFAVVVVVVGGVCFFWVQDLGMN
jgi:hypothetical protein